MTVFPALRRMSSTTSLIAMRRILTCATGGFFAWALAGASLAVILLAVPCVAQSAADPATQSTNSQQPAAPPAGGKVIFSRSTDASGETTTQVGPGAVQPVIQSASEPSVEDADRQAITFTNLDLDVHLHTAAHQIDVRALVTVRNDGKTPLARIPLQISSSLRWEQIRVNGRSVSFPVATLNSDADHTGQLHEAAVPLTTPLAPGASLQLDTVYSGAIAGTAQRLVTIGTPEALALHSDWDQISPDFTGIRGFGNVVWYPVSSVPAILGDGARLFDEIGRHKLRLSGARFTLRLTVEFPHGQPPTVAVINGQSVPLSVADAPGLDADLAGIATATVTNTTLGFLAPSIFVAARKAHAGTGITAWVTPDNEVNVQSWLDAADTVTPFVQSWLGPRPATQLTLLDLPDTDDTPFETGDLLVASLQSGPADSLDGALVHALTHTYAFKDAPAWLNEGLATFMESLWLEKRQGRDRALGMLENDRSALALAEPSSPGESAGTPLASAFEPIYYRTKAAYVLWMLRDLTSDSALSSALRACDQGSYATDASSSHAAAACPLQRLLRLPGTDRDLSWFFADWVNADKGLPDLSITGVYPSSAAAGTYLVAVNVANSGYAAAEVPVTVRTANGETTERLLVPARSQAVQRVLITAPPTQVQVNDGTVPETEASVHITTITNGPQAPAGSSSSAQPPQ